MKQALKVESKLAATLAIGHTRWATHGEVNEMNAHPHGNEIFSIVLYFLNDIVRDILWTRFEKSFKDFSIYLP